jgi:hypothetical protein
LLVAILFLLCFLKQTETIPFEKYLELAVAKIPAAKRATLHVSQAIAILLRVSASCYRVTRTHGSSCRDRASSLPRRV